MADLEDKTGMMQDSLPAAVIRPLIETALREDLGQGGDATTLATIAEGQTGAAVIRSREAGVLSGAGVAAEVFRVLDLSLSVEVLMTDGEELSPGSEVLKLSGHARSLLTAERTALNFLGHMSGVASLTAKYVKAAGTGARIAGTRKTLPGLRVVQKHAIRCGGGLPHRLSLSDAVMIKDNHIAAAGSIGDAIAQARAYAGHTVTIEVEVDRLDQLAEALEAGPDIVLLDNMARDELEEAVKLTAGRAVLEASGGVSLETVGAIAATGVDVISVGALTHSAPNLDLGMDWDA